jgi:plasmid stability protein
MASLTIRNLDENVKKALRIRAAARGVSMEEEARQALEKSVSRPDATSALYVSPTVKKRMTPDELLAWVDTLPKGKPIDPRYETLDHKSLTDLIWDGEL